MKKTLLSFALLLAICLLFFWQILKGYLPFPGDLLMNSNPYRSLSILGYGPGAYPNKAQGRDVITEMHPWKYFTIQELKKGRIPFWNPHNFSGNIHMQNLQSAVFNPFNGFFFLFPFTTGWTLFILTQPILASFFFFLFARELKLSRFASIIGGVGFAFSSYMTVWIEYGNIAATLAYLPLLLFFLIRFLRKNTFLDYTGFVIGALVMILSGYIQGAFYAYVVAVGFTCFILIVDKKKLNLKLIIQVVGMFLFPVFLSAFQLITTYQVFSVSTRWPYSVRQFQDLLQPLWYWITLLSSDFFGNPAARNYYIPITYIERVAYIGIPLLLFACYGALHRRKYSLFFLALAVAVFIFATNFPGIAYLYRIPISVINTTVPTRVLNIFMFAGVTLAAFGIDEFFKKREFPKKITTFFLIVYGLIWVGIFLTKKIYPQFSTQIAISAHNFIIPTCLVIGTCIVFILAKRFERMSKILLFSLIIIDLFYVFQKITPFAPRQTAYPSHPVVKFLQQHAGINRFWGYGSGYIEPNFQTLDGTYSPEGNDPLHFKMYGEMLASSANGNPSPLPRPDANLAQGYGPDGMKNPYRQTLLNLLGVKYIVQHDESRFNNNPDTQTFPESTYKMVWNQNPWQIYENKEVLPRYFLVNNYIVAKGRDTLNKLYASDVSKTVVLNTKPSPSIDAAASGNVTLVSYDTQAISFVSKTTGSMILFLSDAYFPSWKATIDGHAAPVFLADYAFRGLVVPKGTHTIFMYYQPQFFVEGFVVSLISFILFIVSVFIVKRYEK